MGTPISGTINGKTIDLDRDAGLPPGSRVAVSIESEKVKPTPEELRARMSGTARSPKADPEFLQIMELIERERHEGADFDPGLPIMSRAEMEKLADELCGVWEGDTELALIYEKIDRERHAPVPRQVNLDVSP